MVTPRETNSSLGLPMANRREQLKPRTSELGQWRLLGGWLEARAVLSWTEYMGAAWPAEGAGLLWI